MWPFTKKEQRRAVPEEEYAERVRHYIMKLKHETVNKTFQSMDKFKVDGFIFEFEQPLDYDAQYAFLEFAEKQDFRTLGSIGETCKYLIESGIPFDLRYEDSESCTKKQNNEFRKYAETLRDACRGKTDA